MVIKGNVISADKLGEINIFEGGYIAVRDGRIAYLGDNLPKEYEQDEIKDYGDKLVFQSFSDMHLHAPQYPMLGMGMDLQLLDWLNAYTFPTEARFSDPEFARATYRKLAHELIKNGTTRVAMFSSTHKEGTLILMEELEKAGIHGYVGKVNIDRNCTPELQEGTEESALKTLDWLTKCNFEHIKPIITPRFVPSCTAKLLSSLGKIAKDNNLPIQSHLSENPSEIALVKELEGVEEYYEAYKKHGLWNNHTLMAHCVYSNEREMKAIKDAGVYVVHCAASNQNIISGYAKVRELLSKGINVVLGSDIAGGDHLSMFDNVVETIKVSKGRSIMDERKTTFLTVEEAFYLATSAANPFFEEKPGFAIGNRFDAIVLDDSNLVSIRPLSVKERFERMFYLREENAVNSVYSCGKLVYSSK